MARPNKEQKSITVKLSSDLVDSMREFVRNERGRPLFLTVNKLVEQAVQREIERLNLVLSGALPLDRVSGKPGPPPQMSNKRGVNAFSG